MTNIMVRVELQRESFEENFILAEVKGTPIISKSYDYYDDGIIATIKFRNDIERPNYVMTRTKFRFVLSVYHIDFNMDKFRLVSKLVTSTFGIFAKPSVYYNNKKRKDKKTTMIMKKSSQVKKRKRKFNCCSFEEDLIIPQKRKKVLKISRICPAPGDT